MKRKSAGMEDVDIHSALRAKSAASIPFAVVGFLGYVVCVVGSSIAADLLFGLPV